MRTAGPERGFSRFSRPFSFFITARRSLGPRFSALSPSSAHSPRSLIHSLRRGLRDGDTDSPTSVTLSQRRAGSAQRTPITPDVRLYHRAVVVAQEATGERKKGGTAAGQGSGRRT